MLLFGVQVLGSIVLDTCYLVLYENIRNHTKAHLENMLILVRLQMHTCIHVRRVWVCGRGQVLHKGNGQKASLKILKDDKMEAGSHRALKCRDRRDENSVRGCSTL